ncbi:hypothetical protein QA601_18205 [Chitinispirillales bacterium ANBcel5]|uniref:hypothetical protein n=1 Tax=Cellulosispirillum alkaliphilum TaxID=3039283 RepID=UPI002A5315D3|nr:hypothetical protein [Chitinispirillales bacterium ANBcel5]
MSKTQISNWVRVFNSHPNFSINFFFIILFFLLFPRHALSDIHLLRQNTSDKKLSHIRSFLIEDSDFRSFVFQSNSYNLNLINLNTPRHLTLYSSSTSLITGNSLFSGLLLSGITYKRSRSKISLENNNDLTFSLKFERDNKSHKQQYNLGWFQSLLHGRLFLGITLTPTVIHSFSQTESLRHFFQGYNIYSGWNHNDIFYLSASFVSQPLYIPFCLTIHEFISDNSIFKANLSNLVHVNGTIHQNTHQFDITSTFKQFAKNEIVLSYQLYLSRPHRDTLWKNDVLLPNLQLNHFTLSNIFSLNPNLFIRAGIGAFFSDAQLDALYRRPNGSFSSFIRNMKLNTKGYSFLSDLSYNMATNHTIDFSYRFMKALAKMPNPALVDPVKYTGISYGIYRMTGDANLTSNMINCSYTWNYQKSRNRFTISGDFYNTDGNVNFGNNLEGINDTLDLPWRSFIFLQFCIETDIRFSDRFILSLNTSQRIPYILKRKHYDSPGTFEPSLKHRRDENIWGLFKAGVDFNYFF